MKLKKLLTTLSVVAVIATSAVAANICNTATDIFLNQSGLYKYYKNSLQGNLYNVMQKSIEYEDKHLKSQKKARNAVRGLMEAGMYKAANTLADLAFNKAGVDNVLTLLNKSGIKMNINKTHIYLAFQQFFGPFLTNKLQKMNEKDRQIFLEKMYFFLNRLPDEAINNSEKFGNNAIVKEAMWHYYMFNKLDRETIDKYVKTTFNAHQELINFLSKTIGDNSYLTSKDPQIGGNADNLQKFFVYVITKKFEEAFNLIDKTYSNEFINKFNESMKYICKETEKQK